ncbi:hypothetical protein EDB92DRAFT_533701 [Lactarius akahatsu]|uniref:Uncharacterized protein n=1 Tax=Lactarius akahatsu TaxID=416441 RepID=A0AAD4QE37_9AGAM|nr:hypothetical protein EDB92DRAFT_533701 [Lactarius akahatsu]
MITSSLTRLCGNLFWDPYGSKSSIRHLLCETHLIHNVSDTPLARNYYTCRVVSTPSMRTQSGVGLHLEYPSLQTAPGKISSKTNLTPGSPQKSKNCSVPWILPVRCSATSPKAPLNVYFPPAPEIHHLRPVSSATSRLHPQRVPEGPHFLTSGRSIGDAAGISTEWGEGSEPGVSERGSQYSQRNNSAAGSIWPKQQVVRRREETRLKEEDAQGLETAAQKAFAWVQSLEARGGRIHDAAVQAEARAKRMDTMIWKEAEMLCQQAETAKRKRVGMARRGITVRHAEVGRKERQSRRDEAEPSMKEGVVRNKGQEAIRVGEEVQRRKTEIKQSDEKPSKRRAAKDQVARKGVVASAWEKLKGGSVGTLTFTSRTYLAFASTRIMSSTATAAALALARLPKQIQIQKPLRRHLSQFHPQGG